MMCRGKDPISIEEVNMKPKNDKNIKKNKDTLNDGDIEAAIKEFDNEMFDGSDFYPFNDYMGGRPIPIDYEWGKQFRNQKIACIVLCLYPRNRINMQMIQDTYGKQCDGLFWILDKTHSPFSLKLHTDENEQLYRVGIYMYICYIVFNRNICYIFIMSE